MAYFVLIILMFAFFWTVWNSLIRRFAEFFCQKMEPHHRVALIRLRWAALVIGSLGSFSPLVLGPLGLIANLSQAAMIYFSGMSLFLFGFYVWQPLEPKTDQSTSPSLVDFHLIPVVAEASVHIHQLSLPEGARVLGVHDQAPVLGDKEVWSYLVVLSKPGNAAKEVREFISYRSHEQIRDAGLEYVGTYGRPMRMLFERKTRAA